MSARFKRKLEARLRGEQEPTDDEVDAEFDAEIAEHTKTIERDPKCADAFKARGVAFYDKGDYDSAIAGFTELIRLAPTSWAFFSRALVYKDHKTKRDIGRALEDFDKALELDPHYAPAFWYRGILYSMTVEGHERALADLSEAGLVSSEKWNPLISRGDLYHVRARTIHEEAFDQRHHGGPSQADCDHRAAPYFDLAIDDYTKVLNTKAPTATHATALTKRSMSKRLKGDVRGSESDHKLSHLLMETRFSWGSPKWIRARLGLRRARKA